MDEEDIGDHVAGTTIIADKSYDSINPKDKQKQIKAFGNSILGNVPEEFIIPSYDTKGYQILKNLGWTLNKATSLEKPKTTAKNNLHGIGFTEDILESGDHESLVTIKDFDLGDRLQTKIPKNKDINVPKEYNPMKKGNAKKCATFAYKRKLDDTKRALIIGESDLKKKFISYSKAKLIENQQYLEDSANPQHSEELKKISDIQEQLSKRILEPWKPDKILCIRFGIKHPEDQKAMDNSQQHSTYKEEPKYQKSSNTINSSDRQDGNSFYNMIASEVKEL